MAGTALGVGAAPPQQGAAGVANQVVDALVVVQAAGVDVALVELNNSLNNLTALNNVLNNSPILSNNDIDITVGDVNILNNVVTVGDITLSNIQVTALNDFLKNNNIALDDVVGIAVLSGGDLLVFTR